MWTAVIFHVFHKILGNNIKTGKDSFFPNSGISFMTYAVEKLSVNKPDHTNNSRPANQMPCSRYPIKVLNQRHYILKVTKKTHIVIVPLYIGNKQKSTPMR
jgi:hypothetical protein